ncbi:hypothetical protein Y032_0003g1243 [Ancylostoma ceylanicum]|uniref:Uncharacterized protein n=1 Tax=Ancylostoma ceylanicum TaxID=53326 RepID=A0A016VWJ9_9BILA|nr:hypothetical protein Y032_0003g1243 [Ancylostoma ceylanicum]
MVTWSAGNRGLLWIADRCGGLVGADSLYTRICTNFPTVCYNTCCDVAQSTRRVAGGKHFLERLYVHMCRKRQSRLPLLRPQHPRGADEATPNIHSARQRYVDVEPAGMAIVIERVFMVDARQI